MLQNQRPTKNLYRIDSKQNLYRINVDVWSQKVMIFDAFKCEVLDFVACMNLPCQIFLRWKALDFVEWKILLWRAEIDLVMIFWVPDLGGP